MIHYTNHATHKIDNEVGTALLQGAQGGKPAVGFVLSALPHNASVQHNYVGLIRF
jgi:hypothetical protein